MPCLVLDAMGVIFAAADDVGELLIPFIAEHSGTTDETLVQEAYRVASLGEIDANEFWSRVGVDADLEDAYLSHHRLNSGVMELLQMAQRLGVPVCCLSNDIGSWSQKLRQRLDVEEYLHLSIISGDVGIRKPALAIYQALIDASDYAASELLFVDDRLNNVQAARAIGIDSMLFDSRNGFAEVHKWISRQSEKDNDTL
jgi:HAD superfamily hydrolase (TIGR01509 family)